MMKRIPARLFLLFVALLIPVLSHQPALKPPFQLFPHQDKVFHMVEFGGLALALVMNRDLFRRFRNRLGMVLFGFCWAVLDEFHQSFVPGRDCSMADLLADWAGVLAGVFLFSALFPSRRDK
ncbi:MAG TPA: VanZ family protein [Candidatus Sabulitectum sp.]|nr:VanZ family protein [Candidatus Sabulitectum sp.]HPJ27448.1 VanZ family protein [Candidatus Sabulitectum sp.]HRW77482.1 VanZ family protein [Candidatus Sabulitectum sp.]